MLCASAVLITYQKISGKREPEDLPNAKITEIDFFWLTYEKKKKKKRPINIFLKTNKSTLDIFVKINKVRKSINN